MDINFVESLPKPGCSKSLEEQSANLGGAKTMATSVDVNLYLIKTSYHIFERKIAYTLNANNVRISFSNLNRT